MPDIAQIANMDQPAQDVFRSLKDHIHAVDFVRYVPVGALKIANGALWEAGILGDKVRFPKAVANSDVRFDYPRPSYWSNGNVRLDLIYNVSVAGGGNVRFVLTAQAAEIGYANAAPFDLNGVVETVPIGAGTFDLYQCTNLLPVDSTHVLMEFGLFRDGTHVSDTNAGDFQLFGVVLNYIPVRL